MGVRGIRGATTVDKNDARLILDSTQKLLQKMLERNDLTAESLVAAWFTVTPDLDAVFPARAARQLGWESTPLMCAQEIPVPGSVSRCVRVLLLAETARPKEDLNHVYLGEAVRLRPDLAGSAPDEGGG